MDIEFTQIGETYRITGRDFNMLGTIEIKAFIPLNIDINLSMSAVIEYTEEYSEITEDDLLEQELGF